MSGIIGKFRTGGVEFILPKEIREFNECFSFDKCHFIAFEYDSENNFDISQIIKLVNSKFLINDIQINNLDEIYETIMKEISYGFLCKKNLPEISLNFNKEGLLYSIMDDFYKNTLTGNILTFLDYYLKSYVNGGFFEENFIFNWQNNKNENRDYLQKNLIDFTKYLYELTHDPNKINYCSMYDLIQEGKNENNYISAFRIIGYLENNLKYYKNMIFPECSYYTQYDFDVLPKWQSDIDTNINEKNTAETIKNYHKIMSLRVTFLMNKIPFLKPYFELLKMITFAIHYLPNIQRIGSFPLFNNSLQNNFIGEKYCKSIPKVFPPLPIRKRTSMEIQISINEMINLFNENNYENLNKFISICFYESEGIKIENAIKNQRSLLIKIKNFVFDKVKNNLDEQDKYLINFFSDKKLGIGELEEKFIEILFSFPKFDILEDYYIIYNTLEKQDNKDYKPQNKKEYIIQIKTFLDLKKEVEEILNIFGIYSMELFEKESEELNKEIEKIDKTLKESEDKFIKNLKDEINNIAKKNNNNITEQQINEILNKKESQDIINKNKFNLNQKKEEIIKKMKDDYNKNKNTFDIAINKLKSGLDNLQNSLIFYNLITKESIQKNSKFLNDRFKFDLYYTKSTFENKSENEKYFPIRGGCLPEINNNVYLTEKEEFDQKLYKYFTDEKNNKKTNNNKNYYVIKTELRNGFIYGNLLEYFSRNIDKNKILLQISCAVNKNLPPNLKNIKDMSGNSIGLYKILTNQEIPTNEELNEANNFGERPELLSISTENANYIKKILSLPYSNFSNKIEGGMTPLSLSLINDSKNITKILLSPNHINKIGDLNIVNELGLTYLHLAVTSNDDFAVKILIEKGADISLGNRKEDNTPIHLMGIYARNEIIKNIFTNQSFIKNINKQRIDGKNVLHFMSSNSILGTKYLLSLNVNCDIFDKFGNTSARYAFYSGRFDCFYLLINKFNNKFDFNLKKSIENLILESITDNKINNNSIIPKKDKLENLIYFFRNNDYENGRIFLNENKEQIKIKNEEEIYILIDLSCKNINLKLLKLISELLPLKDFCIGPYIGKYGLISWIQEISNLGVEIFKSTKKVLNNKDIFYFCLLNDDKKFFKHLLKFMNKPIDNFEQIISELFCLAIEKGKINIIKQIMIELESSKFKDIKISLKPFCKNRNITLKKLKTVFNNYSKVDIQTLDIKEVMKYSRPNILEFLLEMKNIKNNREEIEKLYYIGIENDRFDNLYTLVSKFPELTNDFLDINDIQKKLIEIEELLQENNDFNYGLENMLKNKLKKILNNFNVGFIKFPINNMYLPHLIIKSNNLWAFETLKDIYKKDIFFVDDDSKTCFDYLRFDKTIDKANFKNLDIIIKYFDKDYENILNVIEIFTNNLNNKNFIYGDEYINYLFSSLQEDIYIHKNNNYNSIFHIISNLSQSYESQKIIINKLISIKNKNPKEFKSYINLQNIQGNTFLMLLLEKESYALSIEIIDKFYDDIDFNLFNYLGNSILHVLFLNKNFEKSANSFIIFEKIYQLLLKILKKNNKLIISQNRDKNTPYILAANSGCNLAIKIFLEFYNLEYLESFSDNSTALHQACISENINTVRFLIEDIHYDPNIKLKQIGNKILFKLSQNSTPFHAAAYSSSIEIFEYLLLHGGDPFIQDINGNDAIFIAYKRGNYDFIKYIFNLKCSKLYSSNDKYILSLVQNSQKGVFQILNNYLDINTFENFNIVDEDMNTLLILACKSNNPEIIPILMSNGIDPLIKNKNGNNCLHICAYRNNISCAGLVLSKLESLLEKEKIEKILITKNEYGDTPLHIAAEYNFYNLILNFISFLIRNDIKINQIKNSAGLTPIQLAIKKHNYKISLLLIKYLDLNINDILNLKNMSITKEFDDFIYCYDAGIIREDEKIIEQKLKNINYYSSEKNEIQTKYKYLYDEDFNFFKNLNYNDFNRNIKVKSFEFLYFNLEKLYKCDLFNEELYFNNQNIFGNIYIIITLLKWAKNGNGNLIDSFCQLQINLNKKRFLIENNVNNDNDLYNFIEVFSIIGLPYINEKDISSILEFLQDLIVIFDSLNLNVNNNFLKFLKICVISYFDCRFNKPKLNEFINEINELKNMILFDKEFLKYFNYTSSAFHSYEYLTKLNFIFKIISERNLILLQIKNLNRIPCLFDDEIKNLLKQFYILHEFLIINNPIYDFAKLVLNKNKNKNSVIISDVLYFTDNLIKSNQLIQKEKEIIVKNIIFFYDKYYKNNPNKEEFSNFLNNFLILSEQILINQNISSYNNIINDIKEQINSYQEIIPFLYIYSSPKEINFPNLDEKLKNILSNIELDPKNKDALSKIASLIPKYCEEYKYIQNFKLIGKKFGEEFKNIPNLENLSKLITIISLGVASILNISPYLIQCLSVSSFLLYYTEKNEENIKGKLAQIKTGEGKSLIIAMLSLANALMGNFVDVITSTHYLAERDQKKFKNFYLKFGVTSSTITKSDPSKSDYDGIILYGTNTDFEFSFLREGIYNKKKLYTRPLNLENNSDNYLIKRTYDVAIVDECDNLFLDTARNSARISHPSKSSFNWLYPIIYKYFNENEKKPNTNNLKNIILEYENGKYKSEMKKINDEKLNQLLESAKIAKNKKLNKDYVIGFDEETKSKQIQIVSLDTGRIQYGSRWSNGIHELIEVKEGIEPETESNVIGSISHPTYFENYKILFGLT